MNDLPEFEIIEIGFGPLFNMSPLSVLVGTTEITFEIAHDNGHHNELKTNMIKYYRTSKLSFARHPIFEAKFKKRQISDIHRV